MERRSESRAKGVAAGLILVAVGVIAIWGRQAGVEFGALVANGWPLFIIVPGVVLLGAAFVPSPPDGLGFATAGSIVTTVGAILLYQQASGNWQSWAYVWALIPLAAGLAIAAYGFLTDLHDLVATGVRLAGVAAVLFLIGWWYFTAVFDTGETPIDFESWWPVVLVGVGALVLGRALLMRGADSTSSDAATIGGDHS